MNDQKDRAVDLLYDLNGHTVLNLLLNFHGSDLISDEFIEYLEDEGILEPESIECGDCHEDIDKREYEENGSPECYDCGDPLCPACINYGADDEMRCHLCHEAYEEQLAADEEEQ